MPQAGPWPSLAHVAGALSALTLPLGSIRILGVLLPFCLLLSLDHGLETAGQREQQAAVLGRHHVLQEPWPQELQRKRRQFGTSACPSWLGEGKDGFPQKGQARAGKNTLQVQSGCSSGEQDHLLGSCLQRRHPETPGHLRTGPEGLFLLGGLLLPARQRWETPRYSQLLPQEALWRRRMARPRVPAPAWEQRALHRAVEHTRFCGARVMLRVPLRELSAQPGHGTEPRVSRSVLTSLSEARLNSTKMCATTSHAKQLGMLTLSRSLMKPRSALLTCQGDAVVTVCPGSSHREATFAWGSPRSPWRGTECAGEAFAAWARGSALYSSTTCRLGGLPLPHCSRCSFPNELTWVPASTNKGCTASTIRGSFSLTAGSTRDTERSAFRQGSDGRRDPSKLPGFSCTSGTARQGWALTAGEALASQKDFVSAATTALQGLKAPTADSFSPPTAPALACGTDHQCVPQLPAESALSCGCPRPHFSAGTAGT